MAITVISNSCKCSGSAQRVLYSSMSTTHTYILSVIACVACAAKVRRNVELGGEPRRATARGEGGRAPLVLQPRRRTRTEKPEEEESTQRALERERERERAREGGRERARASEPRCQRLRGTEGRHAALGSVVEGGGGLSARACIR